MWLIQRGVQLLQSLIHQFCTYFEVHISDGLTQKEWETTSLTHTPVRSIYSFTIEHGILFYGVLGTITFVWVYSFDVQDVAIESTIQSLKGLNMYIMHGLGLQVSLVGNNCFCKTPT